MYKFNFSPGPTLVRENVRLARAKSVTNPDIDVDFVYYYKSVCNKFNKIINSTGDTYILSGEAILGLEAACATLTEPGDRVLVIDNGVYGHFFKDFVEIYGGDTVLFTTDYKTGVNLKELDDFLKEDSNFKYATLVHCDTPTGVINDLDGICNLLKKYGILSVVDSVSGMVGEKVDFDGSKIDIIIGGTQKAISAQPGLTIVSISKDAKKAFKERKVPVGSFYANLMIWEHYLEEEYFPYTLPASDIMSLEVAIDNILEEGLQTVIDRHAKLAEAVRESLKAYGLKLYLDDCFSNTVTAITLPNGLKATDISHYILKKYNVLLATSLDTFRDKILRIGHMGENARFATIFYIMSLLDEAFKYLGYETDKNLRDLFLENYK